jgi:hypothetical protein
MDVSISSITAARYMDSRAGTMRCSATHRAVQGSALAPSLTGKASGMRPAMTSAPWPHDMPESAAEARRCRR